jgi:hypothetical protein
VIVPLVAGVAAAAQGAPLDQRLLSEDAAVRRAAVAEVVARPDATEPFGYAAVVQQLWQDGSRLQAAFWFYLFQARTRPWADADTRGDGAAALRAALNDQLGTTINAWLGADLAQWQEVARRAIAFEARLPLHPARPDGIAPDAWIAVVAKAREGYRRGYEQSLAKADPAEIAATRRTNGLPVGPLTDAGPPLPDAWR